MRIQAKILTSILLAGILYSIYKLLNGQGGGGLGDFFDGIGYTSLVLFFSSLIILILNIRNLQKQGIVFLFMIISTPITLTIIFNFIKYRKENRIPDLTAKYPRPVTQQIFIKDSLHIAAQLDSLIALQNRDQNLQIEHAFIDTIIYSQDGRQIFIAYIQKFAPNELGNDLDPGYLSADSRDSIFWHLQEGPPNAQFLSGSYHDIDELKMHIRKFYFNRYGFLAADSLKENYFWKR